MTNVGNDSNDSHPGSVLTGSDAPSDRIEPWPFTRCHRAIDDRHRHGGACITRAEVTPGDDSDSHCGKVAWRDDLIPSRRSLTGWRNCAAVDDVLHGEVITADRERDRSASVADVGQAPDRRQRFVVELGLLRLRLRI